MFSDRPHPLHTRLYYALCAQEATDLVAAHASYNEAKIQVRGYIHDGLIIEQSVPEIEQKHGLVIKRLTPWHNNVFMQIRLHAAATDRPVIKLDGKKLCIFNSIVNNPIICLNDMGENVSRGWVVNRNPALPRSITGRLTMDE